MWGGFAILQMKTDCEAGDECVQVLIVDDAENEIGK